MKGDSIPANRSGSWARYVPHLRFDTAAYLLTSKLRPDREQLDSTERAAALDACLHWNGRGWRILAAVIMPDHLHLVGYKAPHQTDKPVSAASLVKNIKGYSSREINKLRGTKGSLWQREYHSRLLLNQRAVLGAIEYVFVNPVKAGLVERPEDYPWLWTEWGGLNAPQDES